MSDSILRALMQLFAIVANTDEVGIKGREIVERFLRRQLSNQFIIHYLKVYDEFLDNLKGKSEEGKTRKRTSVNSVKVLRICTEINRELEQKQKIIVLLRLFEFLNTATESVTGQHKEFLNTVAETFTISNEDRENCYLLVHGNEIRREEGLDDKFLVINKLGSSQSYQRHIQRENLSGKLIFLIFDEPQFFVFNYFGTDQIFLDGRAVLPGSVQVFEPGSVIRGAKLAPVYYNDVIHNFLGFNISDEIRFEVKDLTYSFKKSKKALHELTFSTSSHNLVGVMGNSGAGKTTLLNLLNGSAKPTAGKILINGMDLHSNKNKLHGLIGNIPQDDLLIEELTVFQNLFYSSKLYFGSLSDEEIIRRVDECLHSLMLYGIKDLMVGDPLNKYISGGQRKRLNIALELIREPEILFVDEPTSGLSSNDSENVMDLLKHLALTGKLILVVIHQPSSEIFKLFDELLILDTGGYPVYFGNPVDSVRYFKQQMNYVDYENSECSECGNINPEEIFRIIESKTVDEFGRATGERKIRSEEWYKLYKSHFVKSENKIDNSDKPNGCLESPKVSNKLVQFLIYFQRNFFAKLNNRQYIAITLFEGPVLALILGIALRSQGVGKEYQFGSNPNIPVYMFICTIVALFLGLMASAEEIIQDKKILKRESFLQLSRNSYLLSKLSFLFMLSAMQSLLFLLVGNLLLGFSELFFHYFLVLFSVSCFGNLLGLNISSGLKTRVAVYILIPFLIIPQIMLSGVLVKFEDLSPIMGNNSKVPFIGNIMVSRWAYEALATDQFKNNEYEQLYFDAEKQERNVAYRQNYWWYKIDEQVSAANDAIASNKLSADSAKRLELLVNNEFQELKNEYPDVKIKDIGRIYTDKSNSGFLITCRENLDSIKKYFFRESSKAQSKKENLEHSLVAKFGSIEKLKSFEHRHCNKRLGEIVMDNSGTGDKIMLGDEGTIRKFEPVFIKWIKSGLFSAPFYSYSKNLFGFQVETIWFNMIIIWLFSIILYITLYFDLIRKALERRR